ncbi:MAG: hypothetical protein ACYC9Z_09260 [Casimicrobiaceae bacterium]
MQARTDYTTAASGAYAAMRALETYVHKGFADLSLAVVAINGWNRMAIAFATPPGSYRRARSE